MGKIPRVIILACLLIWQTRAPGEETQVASGGKLRIVILKGLVAINEIGPSPFWEAMVQVVDQNDRPVPAAKVLFILPERGPSGTFANGSKSITVATDARGQATAKGLTPNKIAGKFRILVHAGWQGLTANAAITQINPDYLKLEAGEPKFAKETTEPEHDAPLIRDLKLGKRKSPLPPRVTVRSFLVDGPGAKLSSVGTFPVSLGEGKGFGLYSYILFASRPTSFTRARYREIIAAWLEMFEELKEYEESSFQPERLNVTYLPLLPRDSLIEAKPSPDWVLENYDYPHASKLLNKFGGTYSKGPYIISTLQPLSDLPGRAELYLQQDLSEVPLRLVPLFLREFELQAAVERTWAEQALNDLMMNIRSAIEIIAEEEKIALPALSAVIGLVIKRP